MFYRLSARLLDYPDADLIASLPEMAISLARSTDAMSAHERRALVQLIEYLISTDPTDIEADYVARFDMSPELSLHLTHHIMGDDRNRGPSLISLSEFYQTFGVSLSSNELPDFLPLILEFISTLSEHEAGDFLAHWKKALIQLHANLDQAKSPYASLLLCLVQRAPEQSQGTEKALMALATQEAVMHHMGSHAPEWSTENDLDERGCEPPVSWQDPQLPCHTNSINGTHPIHLQRNINPQRTPTR